MLLIVGGYLNALSSQSKISNSLVAYNQARNAAEGVAELAVAEMNRRSNSNPSFGASANPNPLSGFSLSTTDISALAPGTGNNHVIASSLAFKNSTLSTSPSAPMPINGADPINASDPMKDTTPVSIRAMTIYATAAVPDPVTNNPITSYISETVYVRDQTWFNYAMFYNMDIEFHAGPNFDIYGPVFTNANAFVTEGNGSTLNFHSSLGAVGKIYRFDKYFGIPNTNNSSSTHAGYVMVLNKAGTAQAEMMSGINVTNGDSTDTHFYADSSARWGTHAEDSTYGVKLFNPPGMRAYVPEDFTTAAIEMRNNGYLIIEPQLSNKPSDTDVYTTISNYGFKPTTDTSSPVNPNASENLKISALSGLIIRVKPAAIGAQPQWQLICYKATDSTHLISADNPPLRDTDDGSGTSGLPEIACTIDPFNDKDDVDYPAPSALATIKRGLKTALLNAIVSIPYKDQGTTATVWGNGNSALKPFDPSTVPPATTCINGMATFKSNLLSINNGLPTNVQDAHYPTWNGYYPIYDQREGHDYTTASGDTWNSYKGAYNVIRIDLGKLKALLNDTTGLWQAPYGSAAYVYNPATSYTGAVYVQLPLAAPDATIKARFPSGNAFGGTAAADTTVTVAGITSPSPANGDRIRPAEGPDAVVTGTHPNTTAGYAVLLENAGALPQMTVGTPDGFTIATNGPLYIHGNFNADGNSATGSSTLPDTAAEVPAMIAADAVTVLSADNKTGSTYSLFNFRDMALSTNLAPNANNFTEISAAILTGIVPTHPNTDNIWSGGVHNLIRYLEDWSSQTYRFRGSLGVIYQSEVAKSAYHEGHNAFYSPPTRDMGYHQYFSQGRFPPATPIKRTVRRMNLQDIVKDPVTGNTPAQIYTTGPTTPPAFN